MSESRASGPDESGFCTRCGMPEDSHDFGRCPDSPTEGADR